MIMRLGIYDKEKIKVGLPQEAKILIGEEDYVKT